MIALTKTLRLVFCLAAGTLALNASGSAPLGLKEIYKNDFALGAAIPGADLSPTEDRLLTENFSSVTPENLMKPQLVQPVEGHFTFAAADRFVAFARTNGLKIHGHTLVWHQQSPGWFFRDGNASASRDLVFRRLTNHIAVVVGRYRGKLASWDVVNEALADGDGYLRPSPWFTALGKDYIAEAFRAAHRADPLAHLFYNDYSIELPAKRAKVLRLIHSLKAQHIPIYGIGIQGHWALDKIPYHDLETAILAFHAEGLRVAISELDVDVMPRAAAGADGASRENFRADPYANGCPPEVLQRQAEQYGRLFQLLRKHADKIDRVTFWGLHDGRSWLNYWPRPRTNYPLLWARDLTGKPALAAVEAAGAEAKK
jgi:endo-1,4-beta-xylanase